jgi:hypothetical protein
MYKYMIFITLCLVIGSVIAPYYSTKQNNMNVVIPNAYVSSPNLHTIWQFTPTNAISNVNYTVGGNIFGDGKIGFIVWYKTSPNTYDISGISYNDIQRWNISILNYVNFTLYGTVSSYEQTILVQSGATIGPGTSTFALYNAYNGNLIWMNNITLSSGQSILFIPTGISTNSGNVTILFLSSNTTSNINQNILIFNNKVLELNPINGSIQSIVSYTNYGLSNVHNDQFIKIIPSSPGLSSGGIIFDQFLVSYSTTTIFYNYIVSYGLDGILLFNITTPSSNASTISVMTSMSIGNYLGGNNYYIALTFLNVFINNNNIKSEYGSISLLNVNGNVKSTLTYPNGIYPKSVQTSAINFFKLYYKLQPYTPIGNLISYSVNSTNPDILLENIFTSKNEAYLSVLNVVNNKVLWNSTLQFDPETEVIEPLSYSFNGISIPNILLISNSGNITALYGSNGTIMWEIVQKGSLIGYPYNTLAEFYPNLLNLTQPSITSFVTLGYTFNFSDTHSLVNLNVYSAVNGSLIYTKNITLPSSPIYASIVPIGESYNSQYMDLGIILTSKSVNQWNDYFYGIAGNNGSYIFNGSNSFSSNGYSLNIQSGYVFSIFYPGLNNGQVSNDSKIDDIFISTGINVIAYEVNPYLQTHNNTTSFSAYLYSNIVSGYSPLNVSFTVNVSGNMNPYKYEWVIGNISLLTNFSYFNYTFTQVGKYPVYVNVTDKLGVSTKSNTIFIMVEPKINSNKKIYYNITGYVTNTNNLPLSEVYINTSAGNRTITNDIGMFYVSLPNGTWQITATKNGYYTTIENVSVNGNLTVFITLKPLPPNSKTTSTNSSQSTGIGFIVIMIILMISLLMGVLILIKIFKIYK